MPAALGITAILLMATTVDARLRDSWPSSKLAEKADVIVIARVVSVRDTRNSDKPPESWPSLIGVDTTFQVLATIKGKIDGKELQLFHFRLSRAEDNKPMKNHASLKHNRKTTFVSMPQFEDIDGPSLVTFDTVKDKTTRYLLFLKKRPDGRYECVSGQVDPDVSVSKLDGAHDDR